MPLTPAIAEWAGQPLRDRVVIVTGGAQGVGRGIAQAVLGAGGSVMIADLDAAAGKACLQEWALPDRAAFQRTDVASERSVQALLKATLKRFGHLHGLVNNAGLASAHGTPLAQMTLAEWQRRLSSLHGAFLCSKHALPALRKQAGAIVNIASTRAWQSEPDSEAYAAAKGGLVAFTHALALSEGPQVRVNSISPGWIATDAWQAPARRRTPKLSRRDHAQHPAGRVGQPEDIGALAVFLLSELSGFITGQDHIADGGMTRKMIYAD
ncbi:SDR family oxidoreductase [Stenotrophomonas rhizophila]|uniref:SDR family oxidoreductase n=1 Tax=Stenotrophomonas rhizophila TaxID=216778 RepID=UPI001E591D05|nr:SDR family oxidoreductase [Stenotrophomonas rhizophila]MCC7633690.1 SDR family oxidoreductase [Stenotrophomonas rhizophila]MCC7663636.1 SDR family oxidoreductase [Stenotrophomonas rhizophila]